MKIPEIRLVPVPETDEAKAVLGYTDAGGNIGRRHKLGGDPEWIQKDDIPVCPSCKDAMTFYGQLDSIGDTIDLADCGMIYVFVCFGCFETRSILHAY